MERRDYVAGEVAVEERADGVKVLTGYASVFYRSDDAGTQYQLYPGMMERVAPTAFNRALQEQQDVRGLANHDPKLILGRRSAGTLRLSVDDRGLRYEIDLPDTQAGRDMAVSVKRGDVTGSSFAFQAKRQSRQKGEGYDVRLIEDADLYDVGPVTFPAYQAATAGVRCHDVEAVKAELEAERKATADKAAALRKSYLDRREALEA